MIEFTVNGKPVGSEGLAAAWEAEAMAKIKELLLSQAAEVLSAEELALVRMDLAGSMPDPRLSLSGPEELVERLRAHLTAAG